MAGVGGLGGKKMNILNDLLLTSMPRELLTNSPHFKFDDVAMSLYNIMIRFVFTCPIFSIMKYLSDCYVTTLLLTLNVEVNYTGMR